MLEEVKGPAMKTGLAMGTVMEEKEALVIREILHGSYPHSKLSFAKSFPCEPDPQKRNIVSKACFQKNAS